MLPPVAPKAPSDVVEPSKPKGEDGGDMKLDFTFDPDLAQFGDDKQTKHMAIARSLSSEISSANSPISPSTDDLNLKIASVKKVWENVGPLPTVLEHSAVSGGDDGAAVQAPSFGSFGGPPPPPAPPEASFPVSSTVPEGMPQQAQGESTQAVSEPTFGSSQLKPVVPSSLSHHVVVGSGQQQHSSAHHHQQHHQHHQHHHQHHHQQQQQPQSVQQQLALAAHHHHSQAAQGHLALQGPPPPPQQPQQPQQAIMRQPHSMLDQQSLSKVKALHALSPPPAASSLTGLDVRAMANLQVAGMPQAVASPPTALLFTSTQQMTQSAALYQTLLQDPVSRPVAHQFSQATHGYPAPPPLGSYQGFNQGGMFVPPPTHSAPPDMFAAATGAALRLQPTYQGPPSGQVLGQQGLPAAQQLLGSGRPAPPGGAPLGTSYYPSQGGYYPSQQQGQPLAFGSQPPLHHRTFHPPPFKSLELATEFAAAATPSPPKAPAAKGFPPGSAFAFGQGRQQQGGGTAPPGGAPLRPGPPPVHMLQLPPSLVRGTPPPAAPPQKYPAPIQRPQQGLASAVPRGAPTTLRAQQPRQLPTSDQQAKQQAEAIKQAQLFFAQSKPAAPETPSEDGLVATDSTDDKAVPSKEPAQD